METRKGHPIIHDHSLIRRIINEFENLDFNNQFQQTSWAADEYKRRTHNTVSRSTIRKIQKDMEIEKQVAAREGLKADPNAFRMNIDPSLPPGNYKAVFIPNDDGTGGELKVLNQDPTKRDENAKRLVESVADPVLYRKSGVDTIIEVLYNHEPSDRQAIWAAVTAIVGTNREEGTK